MNPFRASVIPTLLMLVLASVSGAASAEREQVRREWNHDQRDQGFQFRGTFRGVDSREVDHREVDSREVDRRENERNDFRGNEYRSGEQRNNYPRDSDPRTDAVYQRLYDDRRDNSREDNSGYRSGYNRGGQRPVNDVVREVQNRYGGQVIGVQNSDGGSMYRVRVLQRDGRVKNVMVPAE